MKSGKYIKRLRKEVGINQNEFGKKVGIPQSNVSQLENDAYDISLSKFIEYCKVLKFSDFNKILK